MIDREGDAGKIERQRISFSTTPHVKALLMALCDTGLYGRTYHETAERLVTESLQRRFDRNKVKVLDHV